MKGEGGVGAGGGDVDDSFWAGVGRLGGEGAEGGEAELVGAFDVGLVLGL